MMITRLDSHPLYALLNAQEIGLLIAIEHTQAFAPGKSLIRIGERTRDILCILQGSVSVQIEDTQGTCVEIARLGEGSLIGEMNFIIPIRRTAHVVALTEVQASVFPYQEFCRLLAEDAALATKIFATLNQQLTAKYLNMLQTS